MKTTMLATLCVAFLGGCADFMIEDGTQSPSRRVENNLMVICSSFAKQDEKDGLGTYSEMYSECMKAAKTELAVSMVVRI